MFAKAKRFVNRRNRDLNSYYRDINGVRRGSNALLEIFRKLQSSDLCTLNARQNNVIAIGQEAIVELCLAYGSIDKVVLEAAVFEVDGVLDSIQDGKEAVQLGGDVAVYTAFVCS